MLVNQKTISSRPGARLHLVPWFYSLKKQYNSSIASHFFTTKKARKNEATVLLFFRSNNYFCPNNFT